MRQNFQEAFRRFENDGKVNVWALKCCIKLIYGEVFHLTTIRDRLIELEFKDDYGISGLSYESFVSFLLALQKHHSFSSDIDATSLFDTFDRKKKGYVTQEDFQSVLKIHAPLLSNSRCYDIYRAVDAVDLGKFRRQVDNFKQQQSLKCALDTTKQQQSMTRS